MNSVITLTSNAGISGWTFKTLFGWMDVPDSLCEVFLSFCLLVVTHTALRHLAAFASDFLEVPEQPKKAPTNTVADSDGPDGTRWVIMYMHLVRSRSQPYNCPYTLQAALLAVLMLQYEAYGVATCRTAYAVHIACT